MRCVMQCQSQAEVAGAYYMYMYICTAEAYMYPSATKPIPNNVISEPI